MGILSWIGIGLVAGLAGRVLMPQSPGAATATAVLGMVGAVVLGGLAALGGRGGIDAVTGESVVAAALGAAAILAFYRLMAGRRRTPSR